MPLLTDVEEPLSQSRSPRHQTLERLVLVDEDAEDETEEQGSRAQKKEKVR